MEPMEPMDADLAAFDFDTRRIVDGYHENLLIVGTRPEAARFTGVEAFHTLTVADSGAPGLGLLSVLEQTGAVRRVHPLARTPQPTMHPMSMGVVGRIAATARATGEDPLAGTSIVELASGDDVPRVLAALAEDPAIDFAARVPVRYLVDGASLIAEGKVPLAQPPVGLMMWNLVKIGWEATRNEPGFVDADQVSVAVLDTGIDPEHPDLAHAVEEYVYDYPDGDLPVHLSDRDVEGHGTHVAGTIAAGIGNGIGIHGMCAARIHAYKIFDDRLTYIRSLNRFVRVVDPIAYRFALRACYESEIEVVNLSIGGRGMPDPTELKLFRDLVGRGKVVVAAMGNERAYGSPTSYPAAIPGVIAVGATGPDDRHAWFSNAGAHIALSAPGTGIWSTLPTYAGDHGRGAVVGAGGQVVPGPTIPRSTDYDVLNGTSMASPHVAAACALIVANRGSASPADIRQRLEDTAARQTWMSGPADRDYGAGRLDLHAALFA